MIRIILLLVFLCSIASALAQNFVLVASDTSGDKTQPNSPDAKAFYFAINTTADSVWFKMEFYGNVVTDDWSLQIGLDTNNNINDGASWQGANSSMKFDLIVAVFYNPAFPPPFNGYIEDYAGNYLTSNLSLSFADSNSVVVGIKLSDINSNGKYNVVAGTGIILGAINDEIPDNNFINLSSSLGIEKPNPNELNIKVTCINGQLEIFSTKDETLQSLRFFIFDLNGRKIYEELINSIQYGINVSTLSKGIYFLTFFYEGTLYKRRFVVD